MRRDVCKLALLLGLSFCLCASAQDYPSKPVRIVTPYAPGGPVDIAARVVAQKLSEAWGQQVIVDNRPGAGGIIGTEFVAKAAPDGYVLLMATLNEFAINPAVFAKLPYDPARSFVSVTLATRNPMVLVANAKAPFSSVKELIAAAKSQPGDLAWSSPGNATMNHITGEWFASEAGIKLLHIPYKGGPAAANAIISGDVPFGVVSLISALPFVKTGTMKVLAVTTEKRTPLAPDWPTLSELGVQGFDAAVRAALFAPAGTPRAVIAKVNADTNRILQAPDTRERFASLGVEPVGSTPEQLDAAIAKAIGQIAAIVERAKIKVQ